MPGFLLHVGAEVLCAHGGEAEPLVPDFRVSVSGMKVAIQASPHIIAGCAMPPPIAGNGPCVLAFWETAAVRVTSMGIPVLLQDSMATCVITGTPLEIVSTQMRVKGDLTMYISFPFSIDRGGRVASTLNYDEHIVELIEQVLFTAPGERVNRPDFGCGVLLLVFQPENSQLATATAAMIQASLGKWLGTLIRVTNVNGQTVDSELLVTVEYNVLQNGKANIATFRRPI